MYMYVCMYTHMYMHTYSIQLHTQCTRTIHKQIVLATNIAETSITIPGVRHVIDTGVVKARSYAPRLGADSLQVVPISQAQASQRSGRAGREAPGVAYRLYTESTFDALAAVTAPEIQRVNLAGVVLQLLALGVKDVVGFDFVDPPPPLSLLRALELLCALGAVDSDGGCAGVGVLVLVCCCVVGVLFCGWCVGVFCVQCIPMWCTHSGPNKNQKRHHNPNANE